MTSKSPKELEFSKKYTIAHSQNYHDKHKGSTGRRLSNYWEQRMAEKSLKIAGDPNSILDLPCGAGRFWPLLAKKAERTLFAADNSKDMLSIAEENCPAALKGRFKTFQTSAFAIDMEDSAVDTVFSMRLLHHIGTRADRIKILSEFARVAKNSVILSLWVDGNYKASRRKKLEAKRKSRKFQNRFIRPQKELPAEFSEAGLEIIGKVDFIPKYSLWRTYVLRPKK